MQPRLYQNACWGYLTWITLLNFVFWGAAVRRTCAALTGQLRIQMPPTKPIVADKLKGQSGYRVLSNTEIPFDSIIMTLRYHLL